MGHRLHVAKKYEVEYADKACFNYKLREFKGLLTELDCYCCDIEDCDGYADNFGVDLFDYNRAIELIKEHDVRKDPYIEDDVRNINLFIKELYGLREQNGADIPDEVLEEYKQKLIADLQEFRDLADPNDTYLHFAFF